MKCRNSMSTLLLALCVDATGSYAAAFYALAVVVLLLAGAAAVKARRVPTP